MILVVEKILLKFLQAEKALAKSFLSKKILLILKTINYKLMEPQERPLSSKIILIAKKKSVISMMKFNLLKN